MTTDATTDNVVQAKGSVNIEVGPEVGPDGKPTAAGWRWIGREFRKPVNARPVRKRGGVYTAITARQVDDRLDQVVGPGNWSTDLRVIRAEHPVSVAFGIAVFGVWKWGIGYSNNPDAVDEWLEETDKETGEVKSKRNGSYEDEPLKAAESDARKRAAVQWGIARSLYPEMR